MVATKLDAIADQLAPLCEKHHVRRLRLFGSTVRGEDRDTSDVDLLVEFEPGHGKPLASLEELESSLSCLFGGRKIDLVDPAFLHWFIRDSVLSSARTLYER